MLKIPAVRVDGAGEEPAEPGEIPQGDVKSEPTPLDCSQGTRPRVQPGAEAASAAVRASPSPITWNRELEQAATARSAPAHDPLPVIQQLAKKTKNNKCGRRAKKQAARNGAAAGAHEAPWPYEHPPAAYGASMYPPIWLPAPSPSMDARLGRSNPLPPIVDPYGRLLGSFGQNFGGAAGGPPGPIAGYGYGAIVSGGEHWNVVNAAELRSAAGAVHRSGPSQLPDSWDKAAVFPARVPGHGSGFGRDPTGLDYRPTHQSAAATPMWLQELAPSPRIQCRDGPAYGAAQPFSFQAGLGNPSLRLPVTRS